MPKKCLPFFSALSILTLLGGCVAAKKITDDPSKLVDDGKRNSVMMSYEIELNTTEKHPSVSNTMLRVRCGAKKIAPPCFEFTAPLSGKRTVDGYEVNTFMTEGVGVFQMKYGEYSLSRADHSIVVEKWMERECRVDKKGKKYCYNTPKTNSNSHFGVFPADARFLVSPGPGCYAGHLKLSMRESNIIEFDFVSNLDDMDDEMIAKLPPAIQGVAESRISTLCNGQPPVAVAN